METLRFVQSFANPFWDRFFSAVTMLGSDIFFMAAMTLVLWCVDKKFGYRLGFAFLFSGLANIGLKEAFRAPRPIGRPGIRSLCLNTAGGYSFPSGHAQTSATFWTSFMLRYRKAWLYAVGALLILAVSLSRLYLGVHWPQDVIGGMIIGVGFVFLSNAFMNYVEKREKNAIVLALIVPIVIGLMVLRTPDYYKAAGAACGFLVGYVVDYKAIQYQVQAAFWRKVVRYIVGLAGLLVIQGFVKKLLPATLPSDFFRYVLIGLWSTALAPYLFMKMIPDRKL